MNSTPGLNRNTRTFHGLASKSALRDQVGGFGESCRQVHTCKTSGTTILACAKEAILFPRAVKACCSQGRNQHELREVPEVRRWPAIENSAPDSDILWQIAKPPRGGCRSERIEGPTKKTDDASGPVDVSGDRRDGRIARAYPMIRLSSGAFFKQRPSFGPLWKSRRKPRDRAGTTSDVNPTPAKTGTNPPRRTAEFRTRQSQ